MNTGYYIQNNTSMDQQCQVNLISKVGIFMGLKITGHITSKTIIFMVPKSLGSSIFRMDKYMGLQRIYLGWLTKSFIFLDS